ncbi:MAG: cation:proton antiporter [Bacillota bacterium]|nr:cation:proton antiporter [Bacillota bacterium]
MESYGFLLDIAIILMATKALGLLTKRFYMPQVVGALLAGVLLGPAVFGLVQETNFIQATAEVGVILLMFTAGMETDVKELKSCGKSAMIIALVGVVVPLLGGLGIMYVFNGPDMIASDASCTELLQNIFVGVILTATSVSITVETLKEIGKLNSKSGNAILAAAIIDDILGIIALTIISSFATDDINIISVLIKIFAFFVLAGVSGYVFYRIYIYWFEKTKRRLRRHTITAFVFCLLLSYAAEHFFGVADITGAYIAGVVIAAAGKGDVLSKKFEIASYLYFSPIFFASIGLKIQNIEISMVMLLFVVAITVVAVITKIVGCGLGARICGYTMRESVQIGTGMISRGEVALIVMSKGVAMGLLGSVFVGPIALAVVITTIVTPILLKIVYR